MKLHTLTTMAALCALPALVQSAHADEVTSLAELKKLVNESLDLYQQFLAIGDKLMSNDIPIAVGAKQIDALAARLEQVAQEIEDKVQKAEPEDQEAYEKFVMSDEHYKRIDEDDSLVESLINDLEGVEYYENADLKAAVDRFSEAFPRG